MIYSKVTTVYLFLISSNTLYIYVRICYNQRTLILIIFYMNDETMDIGQAVKAMRDGKKVARAGWNGKGMFLYYVPANSYAPQTDVAKEAFNGDLVPYCAYVAMKTAQGNVVPWLASQTDLLSEDWQVV